MRVIIALLTSNKKNLKLLIEMFKNEDRMLMCMHKED